MSDVSQSTDPKLIAEYSGEKGTSRVYMREVVPGPTDDWQLADACSARSLTMYEGRDLRVGMRSGMMDAAHLCDLIADEIRRAGRSSKLRVAMIGVAKRCGDAIEEMRKNVGVPDA